MKINYNYTVITSLQLHYEKVPFFLQYDLDDSFTNALFNTLWLDKFGKKVVSDGAKKNKPGSEFHTVEDFFSKNIKTMHQSFDEHCIKSGI